MNNLECRKQGFKKIICKRTKKKITLNDCKNCPYKEYKSNNNQIKKIIIDNRKKPLNTVKLRKKSNKLAKMEQERELLFTDDLEHCIICGRSPINKHEIFGGRNRLNSIKYKLVIPLCTCEHHNQVECKGIHFDKTLRDEWNKKGQALFQETYSDLDFLEIFGKSYLD